MNAMNIQHGLFSGTVIPSEELEPLLDSLGGILVDRNGQQRVYWPAHSRTPRVLEKFSPLDGYAIDVTSCEAPYRLADKYVDANGNHVMQPSRLVTAKLVKEGTTLASATILQPIFGPWAMSLGEQVARGALYDALGLGVPSHFEPRDGKKDEAPQVVVDAPVAPTPTASSPPLADSPAPAVALDSEPAPASSASVQGDAVVPVPVQSAPSRPKAPGINDHIEKNLLQTIEIQSAAKGVTVPVFADSAAAKKFLQDLLRGNVAPQRDVVEAA